MKRSIFTLVLTFVFSMSIAYSQTCPTESCINWAGLGLADYTEVSSDPNNLEQYFADADGQGTGATISWSDFGRMCGPSAPLCVNDLVQNFGVIGQYSCNGNGDIMRYWEPLNGIQDTVMLSFDNPITLSSVMIGGYRVTSGANNGVIHLYAFDGPNCTGNTVAPSYADPNASSLVDADVPDPLPSGVPIIEFTGSHTGTDGVSIETIGDQEIMWCGDHYEAVGQDGSRPWAMIDYGQVMVQSLCYITYTQSTPNPCDNTATLVTNQNNSVYIGPILFCPPTTCSIQAANGTPSNIACDNGGTDGDGSDDTFTFDVFVMGTDNGASWTANDPNGTTGAYDAIVTFGPYPVSGGNLSFTITDDADNGCTTDINVTAPTVGECDASSNCPDPNCAGVIVTPN